MKNRSFFFPLALIATGVIWILVNMGFIPRENLWALVHLWPFLLIALGAGLILRGFFTIPRMLVSLIIVLGAVLAILFAPRFGWNDVPAWVMGTNIGGSIPGSRVIKTETREAAGFTAVSIDYPAKVVIQQGTSEAVTITADDNLLPQLRSRTSNGVLYIENIERNWNKRVNPSRVVEIKITVKDLRSVDFSTAGSVRIENMESDSLELSVSGAGEVALVNVSAKSLEVSLSGVGSIRADGVVDGMNLNISGAGSFSGAELHAQRADVHLSGTGSATLWVEDELDASISGLGSVNYYGSPRVSKDVSGVGSVNRSGDK
jgi:hypothetical protein